MLGIFLTLCVFLLHGVSGVETDRVTVKEGDSITLHTNVKINQRDRIKWFFQNTRIAQIIGNISICTDVQCNEGTERFIDRLKLDHQTGSLTISNIQNADSGLYELQITSSISNTDSLKSFNVTVSEAEVFVFVMEGDSVTLNTGVQTNQQDRIRWYFNDSQIAQITGDQSKICTDVQCKERFRDRLELDHQTGSLTITNTRNTDSGVYHLQINSRNIEKTFNLAVHGVPAAELNEVKTVKEEEPVTLDPGVIKNTNDLIMWYFNDIVIAEITGDQSKICIDVQCKERFRDRLKLDHQTGSLTITNTTNTDSGDYTLEITIISSSFSFRRIRSFGVTVTGRNPAAHAGIVALVVLVVVVVAAAVAVMIYYRKCQVTTEGTRAAPNHNNEANGEQYSSLSQIEDSANGTCCNQTETAYSPLSQNEDSANGTCRNLRNQTETVYSPLSQNEDSANGTCRNQTETVYSPLSQNEHSANGTCRNQTETAYSPLSQNEDSANGTCRNQTETAYSPLSQNEHSANGTCRNQTETANETSL